MISPEEKKKLARSGLSVDSVALHIERVRQYLSSKRMHTFKIKAACTKENLGVLGLDSLGVKLSFSLETQAYLSDYVSFVPAAGASTRYTQLFDPLLHFIKIKNFSEARNCLQDLKAKGISETALPQKLRVLLNSDEPSSELGWNNLLEAILDIKKPKALLPAMKEGTSFLEVKREECKALGDLGGQCFVVPYQGTALFADVLKDEDCKQHCREPLILEQNLSLYTVRIDSQGAIVKDDTKSGDYSLVPAGHGALVEIIPQVKQHFSDTRGIFIRNIDNVIGTGRAAVDASKRFLFCHNFLLNQMTKLREELHKGATHKAKNSAQNILDRFVQNKDKPKNHHEIQLFLSQVPPEFYELVQVLIFLFDTPIKLLRKVNAKILSNLYDRPLAFFGVVANTGKDIGGIPVWVDHPLGETKVCLELPHISAQDQEYYFSDPQNAPYFNPSFVAIEYFDDPQKAYELSPDFWILAQKKFHGESVYYHESVIYELIGNSIFTNLVFIEIPRLLFHPCKSLSDTKELVLDP